MVFKATVLGSVSEFPLLAINHLKLPAAFRTTLGGDE